MASIRKEIVLAVEPQAVWDVIRDVGAVHQRLGMRILRKFWIHVGLR